MMAILEWVYMYFVLRWFLCYTCSSSLFVQRWLSVRRLFCHFVVLVVSSSGATGGVAFPVYHQLTV